MTPALSAALAAFDRVNALHAASALNFADKTRIVAVALDYPPEALMKALIADPEARA